MHPIQITSTAFVPLPPKCELGGKPPNPRKKHRSTAGVRESGSVFFNTADSMALLCKQLLDVRRVNDKPLTNACSVTYDYIVLQRS